MSDDAKSLIAMQSQLEGLRSNYETWWQEIAYRVMPQDAQFTVTTQEGDKRNERIFTGKPITANERFAAVLDELLTPRSQVWHALAPEDDELAEDQEAKEYLERLNKALFAARYRPRANFASQKHQGYLSVGAFGNSCMYIDEELGYGPRYRAIHMREVFWNENHQGQIDTVFRKFEMQAIQAKAKAEQEGWSLPAKIMEAADKNPLQCFTFLHAVKPNADRKAGRLDYRGMPYSSHYIAVDDKHVCSTGGYRAFPFAIGRYVLGAGERYGRGPSMSAWGAILTLNEQKKTVLRAGQKEVDPPVLLLEDGALEPFNLKAGALNHGMVSNDGTPLAMPFKTGANVPLGLELMALEIDEIEEAALVSIFKILAEHPQMTATQVLEIVQQKATLLAPMMGRQQAEDLGPMVEREIDLMSQDSRYGWIEADMPDALRERMGSYKIEYRSPLARAMRAQDGVAIMRTFESIAAAAAIDPDVVHVMDVKGATRELAEINGVPAKFVRSKEQLAELVSQSEEERAAQNVAAAAPDVSNAMLNVAKAEQLRTGA